MKQINMVFDGVVVDFVFARAIGDLIAGRENEQTTLVSWCDRLRQIHSPQCLHCEINGELGWEVYGRNHGGQLRLSFNEETIVLIYS